MASVVVTLKIMPDSPAADLARLEELAKKEIVLFCQSTQFKVTLEPVAFGLNCLTILFVMDEKKGSTEPLEKKIAALPQVSSVEVPDVRRAVG